MDRHSSFTGQCWLLEPENRKSGLMVPWARNLHQSDQSRDRKHSRACKQDWAAHSR